MFAHGALAQMAVAGKMVGCEVKLQSYFVQVAWQTVEPRCDPLHGGAQAQIVNRGQKVV
ncbi:hypothetical protein [Chloroflexus sp.]|uniref:hypothetical protein n=1 Tax=Chloroflexus sp. TaxID=1904827 RepID=UPI002ACDC735|nr:hypothetical protein [Chloroflexus sp.]